MQTAYPITKTQYELITKADQAAQKAQAERDLVLTVVLAGFDVTQGHVVSMTDNTVTVDSPNAS